MEIQCVIDADNELGETPLWCGKTQALWWIDIERPRLQCYEPRSGRYTAYPFEATYLGSAAFREGGGFLLALDSSLHTFDPATGALELYAPVEDLSLGNRLNDGRCDRHGRYWAASMDIAMVEPKGSLYCVEAGKGITRAATGIKLANSVAMSPDQKTLYCSDTRSYVLWAFDLDADSGTLSGQRVFADFTAARDRPDGACVDAEGFLWVAMFAGSRILRFSPDGGVDRVIPLPVTNPTCICFGGEDLKTLYITTAQKYMTPQQREAEPLAGALLSIQLDVQGLPEARFAG
ncbi:MAG: SMP-30/gluconolactonase/LRE family protein [Pseudomonadota bacterium]